VISSSPGWWVRVQAGGDQPLDVLQDTIGSSTTIRSPAPGEQRQVIEAEPEGRMTQVPIKETGTSIIAEIIALQSCKNRARRCRPGSRVRKVLKTH